MVNVATHEPSLEDIFLAYFGRTARRRPMWIADDRSASCCGRLRQDAPGPAASPDRVGDRARGRRHVYAAFYPSIRDNAADFNEYLREAPGRRPQPDRRATTRRPPGTSGARPSASSARSCCSCTRSAPAPGRSPARRRRHARPAAVDADPSAAGARRQVRRDGRDRDGPGRRAVRHAVGGRPAVRADGAGRRPRGGVRHAAAGGPRVRLDRARGGLLRPGTADSRSASRVPRRVLVRDERARALGGRARVARGRSRRSAGTSTPTRWCRASSR